MLPISATLHTAETSGFEVRDVESLREHYALTLQHWVRRLEEHADEARKQTSDVTYRIWRIYLAGSAHAFDRGWLSLFQLLAGKPFADGRLPHPLTRDYMYATTPAARATSAAAARTARRWSSRSRCAART